MSHSSMHHKSLGSWWCGDGGGGVDKHTLSISSTVACFWPHTCKKKYVNITDNYVRMQNKLSRVNMNMLCVDKMMIHVNIIKLHVDINKSHFNIIALYVII